MISAPALLSLLLLVLLLLLMLMLLLMPLPLQNTQTPYSTRAREKSLGNIFKEFSPWRTWRAEYLTNYPTTARWIRLAIWPKHEAGFQNLAKPNIKAYIDELKRKVSD